MRRAPGCTRLSTSSGGGCSHSTGVYAEDVPILATLLFLNAAFNVLVWPQFYKRVARDPRAKDAEGKATTFLKVHAILIAVALVLAVVSALAGVAALAGAL